VSSAMCTTAESAWQCQGKTRINEKSYFRWRLKVAIMECVQNKTPSLFCSISQTLLNQMKFATVVVLKL